MSLIKTCVSGPYFSVAIHWLVCIWRVVSYGTIVFIKRARLHHCNTLIAYFIQHNGQATAHVYMVLLKDWWQYVLRGKPFIKADALRYNSYQSLRFTMFKYTSSKSCLLCHISITTGFMFSNRSAGVADNNLRCLHPSNLILVNWSPPNITLFSSSLDVHPEIQLAISDKYFEE